MNDNVELIPPHASALLESMRSFGYSLTDAIADLMDNSIVASSSEIKIKCEWAGTKSRILIIDNGLGMSYEKLKESMSLGVNGPKATRASTDLGRFGLGMKTASLSQARVLKVYTKEKNEKAVGLCWDLNVIKDSNIWGALKIKESEILNEVGSNFKSGTVIILENLDRIIVKDCDESNTKERQHFFDQLDEVRLKLGMIFHRYISKEVIRITFNNTEIEAIDPLSLEDEKTKYLQKNAVFSNEFTSSKVNAVLVSTAVVNNQNEKQHDFLIQQGIYIYRNDRIVSYGKWLSLGFKNHPDFQYFKISLDFNSKDDHLWGIDVKKTTVKLPREIAKKLKSLIVAGQTRSRDLIWKKTFVPSTGNREIVPLWIVGSRNQKDCLILNRSSHLVKKVKEMSSDKKYFEGFLKIIESSIGDEFFRESHSEDIAEQPVSYLEAELIELGISKEDIETILDSIKLKK